MSHFVFMLTKEDRTVPDAAKIYADLAHTPLRYIGFKDIGLPVAELVSLATAMKRDGKKVMLEVVSTSREAEMRSVEAAREIGVDYLLGGRNAEEAVRILKGTDIQYFPFTGRTEGHPTRLVGTIDEIVEDAKRLASLPGVHGLDLLAYRFAGDVEQLATRVVQSVKVPVLAAGSIDGNERVQAMRRCGVWGFTVGSAVFDGDFLREPVPQQIENILKLEGVTA
ncbi:4-hydroxythreonine-4-phosphate dehydrogenase [Variovorax sp. 160MFSha2.1]|uniref:4-hydroxythreonine-4-phosphate dehydrogenase n=1 Tax=Variovorax sp. 160MFSha2.1 TaxID=3158367 RepID=UPI003AAD8FF8